VDFWHIHTLDIVHKYDLCVHQTQNLLILIAILLCQRNKYIQQNEEEEEYILSET
jgi:hypothetical protein